ncbi:MAG: beta family protein [Pseudorhodoplanes sp.]|nr:beta family protein [Pseudorhodoplanes sp.]
MFNHRHYVPILKWKMGEYQALHRLANPVKDRITPLLEIPPVGFDFETNTQRESTDDHLGDFGKRLKSKWQARPCFVDLKHLPATARCAGGRHCVEVLFETARAEGCSAIPVVGFANDAAFLAAVGAVVRQDQRGVCLRLTLSDFDRPNLAADIENLLRPLADGRGDVDLVIDLGTPNYLPIAIYTMTMTALMSRVPMLNRWRTLTLAGTSYPQSVANIASPYQIIPRLEWQAYRAFVATLNDDARIPTFGDYAVAHPDLVELDMRMIKPFAKLRYTIDDNWHIARGTPVRTHGFGQYQQMCATLVAQPYFSGAAYSAADAYIADCAASRVTTGNLSTWVWVSTNRHLTKMVDDLASVHGLSIAAE